MRLLLLLVAALPLFAQQDPTSRAANQPVEPFRIAGNLYYVGATDVTSFLITTPQGHILLDGGFEETAPMIVANVQRLGFRIEDVRFLLSSHAHYDHAGGLAALKKATGAQFVASRGDAPLLARGGHDDPQFHDRFLFPPIVADRIVDDGDTVTLGGTTLVARITPGHTPGCTTWTTTIADGAKSYAVVFVGSATAPGYVLTTNRRYPNAVADYRRTFSVLRSLHPDIFLASHGSFFGLAEKSKTRDFVDPHGYAAFVDASERAFEQRVAGETIVIHDATVIDGTGAPPRPHTDVVVAAGRITQIGDAASVTHPAGAHVVDAAGKFLIPGLVDMHAHIAGDVMNEKGEPGDRWDRGVALVFLRDFQRFGVTTIRDPGAIMADALLLRRLLRDGEVDGPHLFTAGRILNDSDFHPPAFQPVHDEAAVRDEIRWQATAGVDVVKIYSSMPPELTAVAIDEAHRRGLPIIGHLQRTTWTEAARLGIDGVEHAAPWSRAYVKASDREAMPNSMFGRVYWLEHLDDAAIDEMIAEIAKHHVVVDPTLMATMQTKFWGNDPRWTENPDLQFVPESVRKAWAAGAFTKEWTPAMFAEAQKSWPILLGLVKKMFDRGVELVVGTDTPTPWIVPGASVHEEMKLLADAGIPPLSILRMATFNAAHALKQELEFGSIRTGLRADLVLLSKDPIASIANTRAIEMVIQNGAVVPR
ncbi:MAG TPA: subclass B3 metallo-beta-lactamase [Thermoanaerobaculia bacterium]|nr:subclass B3 metallo-beta-lactamase [Thermoanaerobaculia bacterium]